MNQWLYFDALECLPALSPSTEEKKLCGSRYDLQAALFGRKFQDLLGNLQVQLPFTKSQMAISS